MCRQVALDGETAIVGGAARPGPVRPTCSRAWGKPGRSTPDWVAADGAAGDDFSRSIALVDDTVVVGATGIADNGDNSGAAYVFRLVPGDGGDDPVPATSGPGAVLLLLAVFATGAHLLRRRA